MNAALRIFLLESGKQENDWKQVKDIEMIIFW